MKMASSVPDFQIQITNKLLQDLEEDRLCLPSLPDVALRIREALLNEVNDAHAIADVIQTDPAITAKLIKAANSAMYGRASPIETCAGAVIRLGSDITSKLVITFAMRELFQTNSKLLQQRMLDLWKHSTNVAAICLVLARHDPRFSPEQAMLIGLLHDIGLVAVFHYLQELPADLLVPEIVDGAVKTLRAETSRRILKKWRFPQEFTVAAYEAEEWMRNGSTAPDYCDLLIIAQLHYYNELDSAAPIPQIGETPAYSRLALGELTPELNLKILEEEREQIEQADSLLNL